MTRLPPWPTTSPTGPLDVAVSLIAHRAVSPLIAAHARVAAAWLLGGASVTGTGAVHAARRALALCRHLTPPPAAEAIAGHLRAVDIADELDVVARMRAEDLLGEPVPIGALHRLLSLWGVPDTGIRIVQAGDRRILIGIRGAAVTAAVTAGIRRVQGPVRLVAVAPDMPVAGDLLAAAMGLGHAEGWVYPITDKPGPYGFSHLVGRLVHAAPQTAATITAMAEARHRRGFDLAPTPVLQAWLAAQPWIQTVGGELRMPSGTSIPLHRLDQAILAELQQHPDDGATPAQLRAALLRAGYAVRGVNTSGLLRRSPLVERRPTGRRAGRYHLRRPPPPQAPL